MALAFVKKDNLKLGILLGLIMPIIVLGIHYKTKSNIGYTWDVYKQFLRTEKAFLTGVSTMALVANGLLFGVLIQFRRFETAKGVFIPTVLIGIAVLLYKLL